MSDDNLTIDRPIKGDISHYSSKTPIEQGTVGEFLDSLDAVLAVEGVEAVRWEQYTPYFNDGEACEFTIYELGVKFTGDDESGDYGDGFLDGWSIGYEDGNGNYPYRGDFVTDAQARAFNDAKLNLDRFEDVLRKNFGDPAQVTATQDGFNVEYYEHD